MKVKDFKALIQQTIAEVVGEKKQSTPLNESTIGQLKSLIKESLEEIKIEDANSYIEDMKNLSKFVKEKNKTYAIKKTKKGTFDLCNCLPHHFEIRPKYQDNYEVIYFKDGSDRERKMGLTYKELKDFVKEKLDAKGNYTQKAFNKSAENSKDQVKKEAGLPETKQNDIKKLTDTKNENKDYIEQEVKKDEDKPNQPLKEVGKFDKLSDKPVAGDKVKYTYPKQDKADKKHIVKGGKGRELKLSVTKIKKK